MVVGEIVVFPDRISFVLKVDGLKDLASEMAVGGYFNEAHGDPAKLPETEQEILDDGSVRITMKMESKHIDGHRGDHHPAMPVNVLRFHLHRDADRTVVQNLLLGFREPHRIAQHLTEIEVLQQIASTLVV